MSQTPYQGKGQHTYGKLKLMSLTIKHSQKGTEYLQGFLGNLSVIAFKGEPNQWGETWDIFLQERQPQQGQKKADSQPRSDYRQERDRVSKDAMELFQRPLDRRPADHDDRPPWDE
jgi:hypothetical protein